MKKLIVLLILIIISIMVVSESYKPYPVIAVHGYNTDNYKESNFGIVMQSERDPKEIDYPIASSPVKIDGEEGLWYVSRNEGKRIEYGKLLYQCAEYNRDILDYWQSITDNNEDEFYWLKNDEGKYRGIPSTDEILPEDEGDISVSQPINCFLETIEFDFPGIGSADESHPNSITPSSYQVGTGRELLCKFKEVLINYYTDGKAYFVKDTIIDTLFHIAIPNISITIIIPKIEIIGGKFYYENEWHVLDSFSYTISHITNIVYSDVKLKRSNGTIVPLQAEHLDPNLHNSDPKVIFMAHSYGGVVLRQMLMEIHKDGDDWLFKHIDKFVTVNSPYIGTEPANQHKLLSFDPIFSNLPLYNWTTEPFDDGYTWIWNRVQWLNGINKLNTPVAKMIEITGAGLAAIICGPNIYQLLIPFHDIILNTYSTLPYVVKHGLKLDTDAAYDCQPICANPNVNRDNFTRTLCEPDNLRVQTQVEYRMHNSVTADNVEVQNYTAIGYLMSSAINIVTILAAMAVGDFFIIPGIVIAEMCAGAVSYRHWGWWIDNSDGVIPLYSQNAFGFLNDILADPEKGYEERFNITEIISDRETFHSGGIVGPGSYDKVDGLIDLIEDKTEVTIDSIIINDVVYDISRTDVDYWSDSLNAYTFDSSPNVIYGTVNKYFIAQGNNSISIGRYNIPFNYGVTTYYEGTDWIANIRYGIDNNTTVIINLEGNLTKLFCIGENPIKIESSNISSERDEDTKIIYIFGGPRISTIKPGFREIINEEPDTIRIVRQITFDGSSTHKYLDSICNYFYIIDINDYEEPIIDSIKCDSTGNGETTFRDTIRYSDIVEGRYEMKSYSYFSDDSTIPPVGKYDVFYIDTTPPTVEIANYTPLNKYSLRKNGYAKFINNCNDNFTIFFPFFNSCTLKIYKDDQLIENAEIDKASFGSINYPKWQVSDWTLYEDGLYKAVLSLNDEAGLTSDSSVQFYIDNTPPEIDTVRGFDDMVFNMFDITNELLIKVNEKCNGNVVFTNLETGESIDNQFESDVQYYKYIINETSGQIDSIIDSVKVINAGSWGEGLYLSDGLYAVDMRGIDEVENDTIWNIYPNFRVDRTPPIITSPVCIPLVMNDDEKTTLHFETSESRDLNINTGNVKYLVKLNNGIIHSFNFNFTDNKDSKDTIITIDLSEAPNGINRIEIIAEDCTREIQKDGKGNISYAYAQVIKKSIGTYITKPLENDTFYYDIENIIEGIANDPDMSNMNPFEKYALYWKQGIETTLPMMRDDIDILNWEYSGMYTPIGSRTSTMNENESFYYNEYPQLLGSFKPANMGNYTILLASFEEGKDSLSVCSRYITVIDNLGIKVPIITELYTKNQNGIIEDQFSVGDTTDIIFELAGKISDVKLEIKYSDSLIYTAERDNMYPVWGQPTEYDETGFYLSKNSEGDYLIQINTPDDTLFKSIIVECNSQITLLSPIDSTIQYSGNGFIYTGKDVLKTITFNTEDTLISFNFSPMYHKVYMGESKAEIDNSFTLKDNNCFKWDFTDKFKRKIPGGEYIINLTATGNDGYGADLDSKSIIYTNPIAFDTFKVTPDTVNVLNPFQDEIYINIKANQDGKVKYTITEYSNGNILNETITEKRELDWNYRDDYAFSQIGTEVDSVLIYAQLYDMQNSNVVDTSYCVYVANNNIAVFPEGLEIPDEYKTSTISTEGIYDGKSEYKYSFTADGENYLDKIYSLEDSIKAARMMNFDIDVDLLRYVKDTIGTPFGSDNFLTGFPLYKYWPYLYNINDVEISDNSYISVTVYFEEDDIGTETIDDSTSNPNPPPEYEERYYEYNLNELIAKGYTGARLYIYGPIMYYEFFNKNYPYQLETHRSGIPNYTPGYGYFRKKYEIKVSIEEFADAIALASPGFAQSEEFSISASEKYPFLSDSIRMRINFWDKQYERTIVWDSTYFSTNRTIQFPDGDPEIEIDCKIEATAPKDDVLKFRIKNIASYYTNKYLFTDTLMYDTIWNHYDTITYNLTEKFTIPSDALISYNYDDNYGYHIIKNICGDNIYAEIYEEEEYYSLPAGPIDINRDVFISSNTGMLWNSDQAPESDIQGNIIAKNSIEYPFMTDFPYNGIESIQISTNYPDENLNLYSIFNQSFIIDEITGDTTVNLVSNPRLKMDTVYLKLIYPDGTNNNDLRPTSFKTNKTIGQNDFYLKLINILRAKPNTFLPVIGNIFPDSLNRDSYKYEIYIKNNNQLFQMKNKTYLKDYGEVIGYINTTELFGETEIIVPIYNSGGESPRGIDDSDSLCAVFNRTIFIGNEVEYDQNNNATLYSPYKRGILNVINENGTVIDTMKLMFHIAPEMIVDNGEEPFIGESFCPIININSMKSSIGRPVINYYLTAEEMNEYEESHLKFYGIDNNGEIVQFLTTYDRIEDSDYKTLGYKFYIDGTIYDFEDIEYITLLDSTVTDESKFEEIYTSEITDNGMIFTLESEDMINRINEKGIGIIITDPIENVYDALRLLNEKQQIVNNGNNLFDVIGNGDDNKLLSDDPCTLVRFFGINNTSSNHIVELTDDFVKILIPNDSLYAGYNHLFFGNYDALKRGIGLTDTNFMNLGIDIDNGSTYQFKNSAIKEISFNYIVPKILEMDTLVIIDDYIGEFINILLSDSTSAVIFVKDMLGNQVYTTSLSYQSIENGFHWNGLLNPGQSDNGEYRYEVIPFSVNGVLGESEQGTIIIDRHPDIEIILPEENSWYNNNLLLVAENHTYPIGTINWYMDMGFGNISLGSSFNNDTISFNTNTTINGDNFRIFAESSDRYTNIGIDTVLIKIDNTEPEIVLQANPDLYINNDKVYYQYPTSQAEFVLTDTYSYLDYMQYIIDGDTTNINLYSYPSYTLSFDISELNNKTIELTATDNCGNESGIVEYSFIQDNEFPTVELVIGEPKMESEGKLYISDYTPIWIIADDTLSGIKEVSYTVDTLNVTTIWTEYTGSQFYLDYTIKNSDTLYFRAEDNVGNSIMNSQIFYFDCTPPVSTIEYSEPSYISGEDIYLTEISTIKISSTDDMSGVKELEYTIDGTSYIDSNSIVNIELMGLFDGLHIVTYFATDVAGNIEETQEFEFHIDNTPPTINIEFTIPHYENDYQYVTSESLIDVIAIDNGCGVNQVNYDIDGLLEGSFTDSVSISLNTLLENEYLLNIFGYDNLNNTVQTDSQFVIDNSSPITEMTVNEPKYLKADTILITSATNIELISNDMPISTPSSGVKAIYYGYAQINIMNGNTVIDNIMGIDSTYLYNYYGMDNLNNTETNKSSLFELDNTAPEAIITYPYDGIFINQPVNVKAYMYDKNFKNWKLEYRETNNVNWTVLTDWQTQIPTDSILGIFDGSSVQDGYYIIKLTAEDFVYNTTIDEINIKVGEPVQDLELTGYMKPKGVWADEYIYIADAHNKRIAKVNTDNELLLEIKEFQPTDVFVDDRGRIFATDHDSKVYIYSASGDELKSIDGFLHPKGIEVKNDLIYIADTYRNRIVIYSISGLIQEINGMKHPEGIAIDENGNIFTCIDESNEIRGYNSNGTEIFRYGVVGHDAGEFIRAIDVDIDSKGFLWVCDRNNNRVHMIDWKNKTDLLMIGDRGLHNHFENQMNKPSGLSIVEENSNVKYLYIADTNNDRIVRYNLDIVYEDKKAQIASLAGNELSIEQFLPYPNPTSDESNIRVVLSKPADIVINIFTITGKLVNSFNIAGAAGINEVIWTGINTAGVAVLNGVYNIQVIATNGNESVERWSKIAIIR